MDVCYDKLWVQLVNRHLKRTDLIFYAGISSNVLARLGKNEEVSIESLKKICQYLECNLGDIVEFKDARYSSETDEKNNGVVYTPDEFANYLAGSLVNYHYTPKAEYMILDPAMGDGALLRAMIAVLRKKDPECKIIVYGFDIDEDICTNAARLLFKEFGNMEIYTRVSDYIVESKNPNLPKFDYIIANPPYIRTQILGAEKAQQLSKDLGLTGRVDIYYAFLLVSSNLLAKDGIAGFITSNKFLSIKSGTNVREYLYRQTKIIEIVDYGDTKLFDASVLPCTIIFEKGHSDKESIVFKTIYETKKTGNENEVESIFESLSKTQQIVIPDGRCFSIKCGLLSTETPSKPWTLTDADTNIWMNKVEQVTKYRFKDIGKIRVGIKTTADKVFIKEDWGKDEPIPELTRPLITHRNAGQILPGNAKLWSVVYPQTTVNGRKVAVDLDKYPITKSYLEQHKSVLSARTYLADAGREWYEIWVPQNPESWKERKIIFRDISEEPQFWIDYSGAIVNGDCYWIELLKDVSDDIVLLALAVANSKFIEKYYDCKYNTKLYSGKRRYMTQYVQDFPIPDPEDPLSKKAIQLMKEILKEENVPKYKAQLDDLIDRIFS